MTNTLMDLPDLTTLAVKDPLLTRVEATEQCIFYPYGFPVRLISDSPLVMKAAEISWGTYRQKYWEAPLDVRCFVADSERAPCLEPPVFRSQGHLLAIVGDSENFACLDLDRGFSFGWVSKSTAENSEYFRQCFLDVMIYPLLEIRHLVTLHAACVIFKEKGFLLAGDSGAGKSSFAYACASQGWTYVSDDASAFLRNAIRPEVIGHPHRFRFREPVGELFPEFRGLKSSLRSYGKPTIEVRTASMPGIRTSDAGPIDYIVFLNRSDFSSGRPTLSRLSEDEAWERLLPSLWAVQLPAFKERVVALRRLLRKPIYEIRYREFDPAIAVLEKLSSGELP